MSNNQTSHTSSPCFTHEVDGNSEFSANPGKDCWRDVNTWRISQRKQLLNLRKQLTDTQRAEETVSVTNELEQLFISNKPRIVGVYWPIFSEMSLLNWLEEKLETGLQFCLPVVVKQNHPLEFCLWRPGETMISGEWGIPVPSEQEFVKPDLIIVPLLGTDSEQHRLGYGGGYYDRTLGALRDEVFTVGVGFSTAMIPTIYPQPHDVPLNAVVLG